MTFDPSANLEGERLTGITEAGHQEADRSFKVLRRLVVVEFNQTDQRDDGGRSAPLPVRHGGKRSVTCDTLG